MFKYDDPKDIQYQVREMLYPLLLYSINITSKRKKVNSRLRLANTSLYLACVASVSVGFSARSSIFRFSAARKFKKRKMLQTEALRKRLLRRLAFTLRRITGCQKAPNHEVWGAQLLSIMQKKKVFWSPKDTS